MDNREITEKVLLEVFGKTSFKICGSQTINIFPSIKECTLDIERFPSYDDYEIDLKYPETVQELKSLLDIFGVEYADKRRSVHWSAQAKLYSSNGPA